MIVSTSDSFFSLFSLGIYELRYYEIVSYFNSLSFIPFRIFKKKMFSIMIGLLLVSFGVHAQKIDSCKDIECPKGYKCSEGVCIKEQNKVTKTLCFLNQNLAPIKCTNRNYDCIGVNDAPSCGFSFNGIKTDFVNDCLPCLARETSFFYRVPCSQAPLVCSEGEECVNGECLKLFQEPAFKGYKSCSSNKECRPLVEICVAGKCVKLTEAASALQNANVKAPPL